MDRIELKFVKQHFKRTKLFEVKDFERSNEILGLNSDYFVSLDSTTVLRILMENLKIIGSNIISTSWSMKIFYVLVFTCSMPWYFLLRDTRHKYHRNNFILYSFHWLSTPTWRIDPSRKNRCVNGGFPIMKSSSIYYFFFLVEKMAYSSWFQDFFFLISYVKFEISK